MTCDIEYKILFTRPMTSIFLDESNAQWVGLLFASNAPLYGAEQGSNAWGLPRGGGGDDRSWN